MIRERAHAYAAWCKGTFYECLSASLRVHTHVFFLKRRHKATTSPTSCVGFSTGFRILQRMCVDIQTETVFLCQWQKKKVTRGNRSTNSKQTWLHEAERLTCFFFFFRVISPVTCTFRRHEGTVQKIWHQAYRSLRSHDIGRERRGEQKRHLLCESD